MEVPATLDRSKGDIHAAGNPHYMTDPANARIVAEHVANAFAELDPKSADAYRANLKKFTDELDAKMVEWQKLLAPYKGQQIVAYHDSWPYFAARFGLKIELFLEPKPGIPPTPAAHLAEVITKKMKAEKINVIIVDPYQNRKTAETVARDTGSYGGGCHAISRRRKRDRGRLHRTDGLSREFTGEGAGAEIASGR